MSEDRLPQWQGGWLFAHPCIVINILAAASNLSCHLELPDRKKDQQRYVMPE